ncbi:MAG: class I SAM-dependent methyltransferase, partial [Ruminococcus sp.]|nr:class I SAM-dependent methyltransferase [Ruminococcus sp.]
IAVPAAYLEYFDVEASGEFLLPVHFTRESWNGRIRACRGIGASSLTEEEKSSWEKEHLAMLVAYPQEFDIKHYAAYVVLKKK